MVVYLCTRVQQVNLYSKSNKTRRKEIEFEIQRIVYELDPKPEDLSWAGSRAEPVFVAKNLETCDLEWKANRLWW